MALSATFWGLKLAVGGTVLPPQAQVPARQLAGGGDLHRLLGASAAPADEDEGPAEDETMKLLGVVWPRGADASPQGVALIAVGDQPARPFRTGSVVQGDQVLLTVTQRGATLGPRGGPADTELHLPEPTRSSAPLPTPVGGRAPGLGGMPGVPGVTAVPGRPVAVPQRPMGGQPVNPVAGGGVSKPAQATDEDEDE